VIAALIEVGRLPDPAKATQKKAPPKPNPATVETLAKAETPPAKLTAAPIERTRLRPGFFVGIDRFEMHRRIAHRGCWRAKAGRREVVSG
jgi:hypothetical protein